MSLTARFVGVPVSFSRPHVSVGRFLTAILVLLVLSGGCRSSTKTVIFKEPVSTHEWTLKQINPELPSDWSDYEFLVVEFRASSSQRFELGLKTATQHVSKRIHPYPNVWVRAAIPLRFYRQGLGNAHDLAATVNQPRNSYWINIEAGGHGPTTDVRGMSVIMRYPANAPKLEIRSVTLAKTDPGDAVLEGNPVLDEFGQYVHADWPGKARSEAELKAAWAAESDSMNSTGLPDRCPYGGFASTQSKGSGFFRVEQIDGRWWFVCPDGHLFYSTGVNQIGTNSGTRVSGREEMFTPLPPDLARSATTTPANRRAATNSTSTSAPTTSTSRPSDNRRERQISYYTANLHRRFGRDFRPAWADLTSRRLTAWGLNTAYGGGVNEGLRDKSKRIPYVTGLRNLAPGTLIMGMPDVYADSFEQHVQNEVTRQLTPMKDDAYLIGYFIGNEPPWPSREDQFVDLVLQGSESKMQAHFKAQLASGDTPERRRELVLAAFERYLGVINAATKKADPNHLNLGIRFGGTPPDYVVKLAKGFDVYSLNKYRWDPPPEQIKNVYELVGKPILIGEFHIGVPGRGLAPGLVQAMNQFERGIAYQFYVEGGAAHPEVIGSHWFQWIDQPATGRGDGENYNIGWIDVTDRPYSELVEAAKITHGRLLEIHSGKIPPTKRMPKASEVGTPPDVRQLGIPAIQ
ncbi:MAG: hypothetical protein H7144_13125 [Burkholderiales bacterium]|nr:hypothetical protein [Phycisphaerae bacterium]